MTTHDAALDPSELLTIDVESELVRLGGAQLEGPWQVAVELVRHALAAGARRVETHVGNDRLTEADDGQPVSRRTLERLAEALDPARPAEQRHAAIVALEAERLSLLAVLPGLGCRELVVSGAGVRLCWRRGTGTAAIEPTSHSGASIALRLSLDAAVTRRALARACGFAPAVVTVDGAVVPSGWRELLGARTLAEPLEGRLALGRELSDGRVSLLLGGVVAARVTAPGLPPVEAVLELGQHTHTWSPLAARETWARLEPSLHAPALELLLELGGSIATHPETDQRRIRRALLETARRRLGRSEILRLPLLRRRHGRREEWLSLAEVGREGAPLVAIPPGRALEDYVCPGPALILEGDERALLGQLIGLTFSLPPLRRSPRASLGAWLRSTRSALGRVLTAPLGQRRGAPLPTSSLSPGERVLQRAAREGLSHLADETLLCSGRAAPGVTRRGGRRVLLLSRDHPRVAAAARLVERDPCWTYPVLVALLEGRELPDVAASRAWRQRLGVSLGDESDG